MNNLKVCWLSSGISSFIAGVLEGDIDEWIYIDISDQHPDSLRFIHDIEKALNINVTILSSSKYHCVEDAILEQRCIRARNGFAPCTNYLKKRVRREWELQHTDYNITYVWGFDYNEVLRADRLEEAMPNFKHSFPLIRHHFYKSDVHGYFLKHFNFPRPIMYDLGYPNNNCIGCVKGGMGYWNKIRVDFPEVFKKRSDMEITINSSILKKDGKPLFLKDLPLNAGNMNLEVFPDCSIFCQFPGVI